MQLSLEQTVDCQAMGFPTLPANDRLTRPVAFSDGSADSRTSHAERTASLDRDRAATGGKHRGHRVA